MSARRRVLLLVVVVAAVAAAVVGAAVVSSDGDSATTTEGLPEPRPGRPPLSLSLGFRTDAEARDLQRGATLHARGRAEEAAALFEKHDSLEARIGAAFAHWPETTYDRMEQLAKLYPEEAVVQLHLGLARLWAQRGDPVEAWRAAAEAEPDTPYAILAGNVLFPKLPRGLPAFLPSFSAPPQVTSLPPARQLAALERRARGGERATTSSSTASGSSASAAPSPPERRSTEPPAQPPATSRRRSPPPSAGSRRTRPRTRSAGSAR